MAKKKAEPVVSKLPVWGAVLICKAPRNKQPRLYIEQPAVNELEARRLVNERLFGTWWHIQSLERKTGERANLWEEGYKLP